MRLLSNLRLLAFLCMILAFQQSMRKPRTPPPNPALDLFGEVPILESEIVDWVEAVAPRWLSPERSFRGYVKSYNIVEKIRAAKLNGTYQRTIDNPRGYPVWHARLALSVVC